MVPSSREERDEKPARAGGAVELTLESCYAAGLAALDAGALEEARQWAERCDRLPHAADDARCAALHGAVAAEAGEREKAAAHFRRAAEQAPEDARVARQVAEVLAVRGALDAAAVLLEKAAERDPTDANVLVDLGYLRLTKGDRARACAALERAASLRPADADIARCIAQAYEALGEPARAASTLAAAAERAPSPRTLAALARLYLRLERYPEAEAAFRTLQQLDPDHQVFAHHGQTWCRIKRGDWRGALDVALSTTRLDRFSLTTAFLAYAKDRLFGEVSDTASREAELAERFSTELEEHDDLHDGDVASSDVPRTAEEKGG